MITLRRIGPDKALMQVEDQIRVIDVYGLDYIPDGTHAAIPEAMKRFEGARPKPAPQAPVVKAGDSPLRVARRVKLREIAAQVTAARDRGFAETDRIVPAKGLELARQVDVVLLYLLGDLKDNDTIWARNWWTGHQEQTTLKDWLTAMRESFRLRQLLRQHEQNLRDQVEAVFQDESKSVEKRISAIEQITVPPYLDLPEQTTIPDVENKLRQRRAAMEVKE